MQRYWMRSVSFAKLHWILCFVADHPTGIRAKDINRAVVGNGILHGRALGSPPSPTTLYHYRTTLVRLEALRRHGGRLYANDSDPDVRGLVQNPPRSRDSKVLDTAAKTLFAALVLRNDDCRSSFFDAFMTSNTRPVTVSQFRRRAEPVKYTIAYSESSVTIMLENKTTGKRMPIASTRTRRGPPPVVQAVPYGIRYWACRELDLVDEYCHRSDGSIVMFPLSEPTDHTRTDLDPRVRETANYILSLRDKDDWTMFSIYHLITACCERRRESLRVLFKAIDLLMYHSLRHIVLIPTPLHLATIGTRSRQRENLALRNYYRYRNGPYISHLRIHKLASLEPISSR